MTTKAEFTFIKSYNSTQMYFTIHLFADSINTIIFKSQLD